jgi:hypothetical protein
LQKDPGIHATLQRHLEQVNAALALERRNALRRPVIQRALNQSVLVRPQIAATVLHGGASRKEAP